MTNKSHVLTTLRDSGVVAIIRTDNPLDLVAVARALHQGGVKFVEITLTVPGALEILRDAAIQLRDRDVFLGAGTVLDAPTARAAVLVGAQFIVGPTFDPDMVRVCNTYGVAVMPGAFTPQEILAAWKGGADVVKLFPADHGGPAYLRTVRGPLPQIEFMPTGGVDDDTAPAYIRAGAVAVGVGGNLVSKNLIAAGDYARITANAAKLVQIVREAKARTAT